MQIVLQMRTGCSSSHTVHPIGLLSWHHVFSHVVAPQWALFTLLPSLPILGLISLPSLLMQSLFLAHLKFQITDDDEQPAQPPFCCVSADPRRTMTKPPMTTVTSECICLYDFKQGTSISYNIAVQYKINTTNT